MDDSPHHCLRSARSYCCPHSLARVLSVTSLLLPGLGRHRGAVFEPISASRADCVVLHVTVLHAISNPCQSPQVPGMALYLRIPAPDLDHGRRVKIKYAYHVTASLSKLSYYIRKNCYCLSEHAITLSPQSYYLRAEGDATAYLACSSRAAVASASLRRVKL